MAKKDNAGKKSLEDMSAEREAAVNADLEAASDRMAEAQGEAILENIRKRTDEVKGEKERKRNYHLQQGNAVIDNEKERVNNTAVNVGAPQAPLNFEPEEISNDAGRTFKRDMAKNQYDVRQDLGKRALAAETEAAAAASDKMADKQAEGVLDNINDLIARREREIAEGKAAAERKEKYLSDQQAAINANKKKADMPATPAGDGQEITEVPGKTDVPGKTEVPGEAENVKSGRAARAANYDAESMQEKAANPAGDWQKETEVPGKTEVPGVGTGKKPAGGTAPIVHNAEERFQKNVEGVKEKLKYEPILDLIRRIESERDANKDNRSEAQKKRDARREKMAKIFAALGDGVAAMSNLVLTSKGAIPYQSKSMVSNAVGDRYEQFRKDLENRKSKYLELSEKAAALRQKVQDMKDEEEARKAAQERLKNEDERRRRKEELDAKTQRLKNSYTSRAIKKMDEDANYKNTLLQVRQALLEVQRMNAKTARMRANNQRSGGGSGRTTYTTPWDGKSYSNYREWEAAVYQKADELNIDRNEIVDYRSGRNRNQKVVPKSTTRVAGEVANKVGGKASSLKL